MLGESFISVAGYLFIGLWSVFVAAFGLVTFASDLLPSSLQSTSVPSYGPASRHRQAPDVFPDLEKN